MHRVPPPPWVRTEGGRGGEGGVALAEERLEAGGDERSGSPRISSTMLKNVDFSGGTRGSHPGVGVGDIIGSEF